MLSEDLAEEEIELLCELGNWDMMSHIPPRSLNLSALASNADSSLRSRVFETVRTFTASNGLLMLAVSVNDKEAVKNIVDALEDVSENAVNFATKCKLDPLLVQEMARKCKRKAEKEASFLPKQQSKKKPQQQQKKKKKK